MTVKNEEGILSFLAIVSSKTKKDQSTLNNIKNQNQDEHVSGEGDPIHHDKKQNASTTSQMSSGDHDTATGTDDKSNPPPQDPALSSFLSNTRLLVISKKSAADESLSSASNTRAPSAPPKTLARILRHIHHSTKLAMYHLFLPLGYPESVKPGYIQYQIYDSIQGLCSYLRGVISTGAILTAAGVGNAEATATSAAIQWAIKDGCGMMGGLLFSYYTSAYFDSHVKEFRLLADVMNDMGLILDMISPLLLWKGGTTTGSTALYVVVSMAATLCRVICGMAAGATKHSITQHFAKGNSADLSAKEGTQETLVSLLGMVLGISLAKFLQDMEESCCLLRRLYDDQHGQGDDDDGNALWNVPSSSFLNRHGASCATWFVFSYLTVMHIWANYEGVKMLKLNTLNRARCKYALKHILDEIQQQLSLSQHHPPDPSSRNNYCLSIQDWSKFQNASTCSMDPRQKENASSRQGTVHLLKPEECCESLWQSWKHLVWKDNLLLGVNIKKAFSGLDSNTIHDVLSLFKEEDYVLTVNIQGMICVACRKSRDSRRHHDGHDEKHDSRENASFDNKKGNSILLKSFVHALIVQQYYASCNASRITLTQNKIHQHISVIKASKKHVDALFAKDGSATLLDILGDFGWNIERLYLCFQDYEFVEMEKKEETTGSHNDQK